MSLMNIIDICETFGLYYSDQTGGVCNLTPNTAIQQHPTGAFELYSDTETSIVFLSPNIFSDALKN